MLYLKKWGIVNILKRFVFIFINFYVLNVNPQKVRNIIKLHKLNTFVNKHSIQKIIVANKLTILDFLDDSYNLRYMQLFLRQVNNTGLDKNLIVT